jgi:hypothetical protein
MIFGTILRVVETQSLIGLQSQDYMKGEKEEAFGIEGAFFATRAVGFRDSVVVFNDWSPKNYLTFLLEKSNWCLQRLEPRRSEGCGPDRFNRCLLVPKNSNVLIVDLIVTLEEVVIPDLALVRNRTATELQERGQSNELMAVFVKSLHLKLALVL